MPFYRSDRQHEMWRVIFLPFQSKRCKAKAQKMLQSLEYKFKKYDLVICEEIMKDRVLCSALVDRLCHKAYLVNMTGKSYRIRETQNMFKK